MEDSKKSPLKHENENKGVSSTAEHAPRKCKALGSILDFSWELPVHAPSHQACIIKLKIPGSMIQHLLDIYLDAMSTLI